MRFTAPLQTLLRHATDALPDVLLVAGAATLAYGAHLVYAPAGYLVGGALLLAAGWLLARGAK